MHRTSRIQRQIMLQSLTRLKRPDTQRYCRCDSETVLVELYGKSTHSLKAYKNSFHICSRRNKNPNLHGFVGESEIHGDLSVSAGERAPNLEALPLFGWQPAGLRRSVHGRSRRQSENVTQKARRTRSCCANRRRRYVRWSTTQLKHKRNYIRIV